AALPVPLPPAARAGPPAPAARRAGRRRPAAPVGGRDDPSRLHAAGTAGAARPAGTAAADQPGPLPTAYAEISINRVMRSARLCGVGDRRGRVLRAGAALPPHNVERRRSPLSRGRRCLAGHQRRDETVAWPEPPRAQSEGDEGLDGFDFL